MIGNGWGTRRWAAGVVTTLALALSACGASGGSASTSSSSGAASTATPATSSAAASSSPATTTTSPAQAAAGSSAIAAPGTKLTVGQETVVTFHPPGAKDKSTDSTLKLAVRTFQKGTLSDFSGIQLDASERAGTPYYVRVHVSNLGPHSISVDAASAAIEGVDTTGTTQQSVTFIGDFPHCPDNATTTPLPTGKTYDSCLTFLVPGGITKVAYSGTDDYINSPVTWAPK
jgi:hypothetical protein